ncbi:MAG: MOSC N-terminal beta barrel domain-containing protein [Betaproteobacteria bacterium]|nr:MOSC N-terminal beta barrel domain-containing protein [Betaproteobacteria bacterium]
MTDAPSPLLCRVGALFLHPVKSCAGIALTQGLLVETGIEFDRAWMVVDEHGEMLTQRELPRMALIQPTLRHGDVVLRAPGMLALHLMLDTVEAPTRVRVWDDVVRAYDMGPLAAQWFSDFLGTKLHLVRFDPEEQRLSDPQWAGDVQARNTFADGYPLLVTNSASLADLNERLAARGATPVTMQRFRPNLVLDGLPAYDEDHLHEIDIATDEGTVTLRLVKPCTRCSIPNIEPASAETGSEPSATLAGYRTDARMHGGITFGMNAVIVQGVEHTLRVGQAVNLRYAFR